MRHFDIHSSDLNWTGGSQLTKGTERQLSLLRWEGRLHTTGKQGFALKRKSVAGSEFPVAALWPMLGRTRNCFQTKTWALANSEECAGKTSQLSSVWESWATAWTFILSTHTSVMPNLYAFAERRHKQKKVTKILLAASFSKSTWYIHVLTAGVTVGDGHGHSAPVPEATRQDRYSSNKNTKTWLYI